MKFLSVIVPIYKIQEDYLRHCLDSLLNQNRDLFELILIDDGSPDNCGKICDEYRNRYDNICVVHQENQGVSEARNQGIIRTKTEWMSFIDPDDWVEDDYIEKLSAIHNQALKADIVMFDYYREYEMSSTNDWLFPENKNLTESEVESIRLSLFHRMKLNPECGDYEIGTIWNKMYRTEFIKRSKVLFIKEARKGQDTLFNARLFQMTDCVCYEHKALYRYRCSTFSITNRANKNIEKYIEVVLNEFKKIMADFQLGDRYEKLYNAHTVTRLYSILKLHYFNKEVGYSYHDAKKGISDLLNREPYYSSLLNVDYRYLSYEQKLFVALLRMRCFFLIRGLINGRKLLQNMRGKKLSRTDHN